MGEFHKFPQHPAVAVLAEPIKVSPLIRFSRWTALGLGVVYGFFRYRHLCEYHADIRDWEHEKAVAKAQKDIVDKKWASRDEMRYIIKTVGLPFEDGIAQLGVADLYRDD